MSTPIQYTEFKPNTEGVFQIADAIYHDHNAAPEISRGLVVEIISKSPAHVRAVLDGKRVKKITPAMIVGTLMDKALLEPDRFKEGVSHWVRPEGLDLRTKAGIAWKESHPDLPVIPAAATSDTSASVEDIKGMIESVMAHKLARRIVEESKKQESCFVHDPDTGLLRKCRPDCRLADNSGELILADLKTTFPGGASASAFSAHCARMSYHLQHSFYSDIYKDLLGEQPWFLFFVVERKPPYAVRVFQIHDEGVRVGREKYKRGLELFRACKESNIWPAYPQDAPEIIRLPNWELNPPDPIVIE